MVKEEKDKDYMHSNFFYILQALTLCNLYFTYVQISTEKQVSF